MSYHPICDQCWTQGYRFRMALLENCDVAINSLSDVKCLRLFVELVSGKENDLTKLEMEYELQKQILKAKQKLANDETLSKNVRKKHNADYVEAKTKVVLHV